VLFAGKARGNTGKATLAVLLVLAVIPVAGPSGALLAALSLGLIYAIATVGLDVYSGYGGLLSFGNFSFVAIGAYTSAILSTTYGWNYWATLPAVIVVCGVCSAILGVAMVRLPDLGAAFMTFFFGFVVVVMLGGTALDKLTQGENGISVPPQSLGGTSLASGDGLYYLALVLLIAIALLSIRYVNSRAGRVLRVVKRSDVVASSLGIRVSGARLSAFVYSAMCAGIAGFVFALSLGFLAPESFDYTLSIELVVMLVVGGVGSITGGIVGAVLLELLSEWTLSAGQLSQVINALLLIVVIIVLPQGLYGLVERFSPRIPASVRQPMSRLAQALGSRRPRARATEPTLSAEFAASEASQAGATVMANSPPPAALHVRDLTVAFGGVHALNGVAVEARRGEVLGVMGPNGAGKTTLLNCISGIQRHCGSIQLDDVMISGQSPRAIRKAGVARTFQNPSLVPDLSILENVELGAYGLNPSSALRDIVPTPGVVRRDRAARELASHALDLVRMPAAIRGRMASEVSLAEQKMTDLARAIAGQPSLLLLDEPTAGLDGDGIASLKEALLRVSGETSMTIVVIAHHIGFLRQIADRVVVLDFGEVLAHGTCDQVLKRNEVIEAFVGTAEVG
jgi:branched-chain amino acid transport system permease protein